MCLNNLFFILKQANTWKMKLKNWFPKRGNHNPCLMVNVEFANLFNIYKMKLLNACVLVYKCLK